MTSEYIAYIGIAISWLAAIVSYHQANIAKQTAAEMRLSNLFGTFDRASEMSIDKPFLLRSVHGIQSDIDDDEASAIAYLCMLLDGFQYYYGELDGGDFSKMLAKMKAQTTMLNRLLAVSDNQNRWEIIKKTYYGEFDISFIKAIDDLIRHINKAD